MYARRRHVYFLMMGGCLVLFVSAWAFVRLWSVPAAIAMCFVAMVIPPVAAMVANRRGPEDRWWDDPSGDPESDQWWDELDGKKRRPDEHRDYPDDGKKRRPDEHRDYPDGKKRRPDEHRDYPDEHRD